MRYKMKIIERDSLLNVPVVFQCSNCDTIFTVDRTEMEDYICEETFDGKMLMQRWISKCPCCHQKVKTTGFRLRNESEWNREVLEHDDQ